MNRYLLKIASDRDIAEKSLAEETKAIKDYGIRSENSKNPSLKKAIDHARSEEKDHASGFKKVLLDLKKNKV